MRNQFKKIIKNTATFVFRRAAFSTSASACLISFYQPKEPKCLQQKKYKD
ncbi:MAG: cyclic lactone autoinducer peptide [Clostridium sp.]